MATPALSVSCARADVKTFSAVSMGPSSSSQGIESIFCQAARGSLQSSAMFPLIFCNLCAQKLRLVRTFLERTDVCATTHE